MQPPRSFLDLAAEYGIAFEPGDLDRLGRYLELLLETNRQFNLTSITAPDEAWVRHIFDSLTLLPYVHSIVAKEPATESSGCRVIDVGSGGGLPGLPLAIVQPAAQFTLLEATGKKARFLERVREDLQLSNVVVVHDRAETAGQDHKHHREKYDLVLSRAVGGLPILLELTVPFAKVGGLMAVIKGARALEEVEQSKRALRLLHAAVIETKRTPTGTIVAIEKLRRTPRVYPRPAGEPKRRPLVQDVRDSWR